MGTYRNNELQYLEDSFNKDSNEIIVIYGHKYVGTDEVIKEYLKDKTSITLSACDATARQQCYLWAGFLRDNGITISDYPSFIEIMESVSGITQEKLVLLVEDFDLLIKSNADSFEAFLHLINMECNVQVLLVSSSISFIENSLVPRIGRNAHAINGFLKIKPLSYSALCEYFYNNSKEECLQIYAILGGYKELWYYFDTNRSVSENIIKNILNPLSCLHKEALNILNTELRELNVYGTILKSLAENMNKLNDIYDHTGFSRAKISVYLKNLMELEVVEKMYSIDTPGRDNTKKGIYRISHPFIRFYYTYMHGMNIKPGSEEFHYKKYIQNTLRTYAESVFEDVCSEYFIKKNNEQTLAYPYDRIGKWLGKAGTIPVLADCGANYMAGYCSYDKPIMTYEDYEWFEYLLMQAQVEPSFVYLFAITGFDEKILLESKIKGTVKTVVLEDF